MLALLNGARIIDRARPGAAAAAAGTGGQAAGSAAGAGAGGAPLLDATAAQLSGGRSAGPLVYSSDIAVAAAAPATAPRDAPGASPAPPPPLADPPPFPYPPVRSRPTVFFTAAMSGLKAPEDFTPAMAAAYADAVSAFLGPAGAAGLRVLAVQRASAGVWVPTRVEMVTDPDDSLRGLLLSTLRVGL